MKDAGFLKRLERELPRWVEQGWVAPANRRAILDDVAARASQVNYLTLALSLLGVVLLGAGVITFFAANWGVIPKIGKLALLFGVLWAAYAAAGYVLGRGDSPHLGQALVLLAVLLFGANIMLIAQAYHIDAHYPDGVLTWALGALLAAWLLASQPALAAAIALGVLWTGMESFGFERPLHWPFLALLAPCLWLVARHRWHWALRAALAGLLLWSLLALSGAGAWGRHGPAGLAQAFFAGYLLLFVLTLPLERRENLAGLMPAVRRFAVLGALAFFYLLTFPRIHQPWRGFDAPAQLPAPVWAALTVALLAAAALLAAREWRRRSDAQRPPHFAWGLALLALVALLVLVNLLAPDARLRDLTSIGFNLAFFAAVVWLIWAGYSRGDRGLVNLAFGFFALALASRYLDTFWTLLGRSYFFMVGGLILIGGGYFLERQRRRLTRAMSQRAQGGAA